MSCLQSSSDHTSTHLELEALVLDARYDGARLALRYARHDSSYGLLTCMDLMAALSALLHRADAIKL
jgi:hypothetical protein